MKVIAKQWEVNEKGSKDQDPAHICIQRGPTVVEPAMGFGV